MDKRHEKAKNHSFDKIQKTQEFDFTFYVNCSSAKKRVFVNFSRPENDKKQNFSLRCMLKN